MSQKKLKYVKPRITQLDYAADTQVSLATCKFPGQAGLSGFNCDNSGEGACEDIVPS